MQKDVRMQREMLMLTQSPPPGVSCHQDEKNKDVIRARELIANFHLLFPV